MTAAQAHDDFTAFGTQYENHPEGQYRMHLAEIIKLPPMKSQFNDGAIVQKFRWVFVSEGPRENGKAFEVSKFMTMKLGEKSTLGPFLTGWLGRGLTFEEINTTGVKVRSLIGQTVLATVIHKRKDNGQVQAEISAVMKLPRGMEPLALPRDYVPVANRPAKQGGATPPARVVDALPVNEAPPHDDADAPGPYDI